MRKTGEIVDIICWNGSTIRSHLDTVSYIDSQGVEHDRESLNYYWDFEQIDKDGNDAHWREVRNQAAIAAMIGVMEFFGSIDYEKETIAKMAVEQADALIDELKLL